VDRWNGWLGFDFWKQGSYSTVNMSDALRIANIKERGDPGAFQAVCGTTGVSRAMPITSISMMKKLKPGVF